MLLRRYHFLSYAAALFALSTLPLFAAEATTDTLVIQQAEALVNAGNYEAAYQQLLPLEKTLAGQLEFDVLLGSAAVEITDCP